MKKSIFICLILSTVFLKGQTDSTNVNTEPEEDNKISFAMGTSILTSKLTFSVTDDDTNEKVALFLKPKDMLNLDFYIRYRWIDFSFFITPKFFTLNNDSSTGKTKRFNLGFTFFPFPKLRQQFNYHYSKGYYISNSKELFPGIESFIRIPDYSVVSISGETGYLWVGDKLSSRSYTNITYRPEVSNFLLITGLFYRYSYNSSSFTFTFPDGSVADVVEANQHKELDIALKVGGGAQKKIGKNYFIVLELYPSLNYTTLLKEKDHEISLGLSGFSRAGYDDGKFFVGGLAVLNWLNSNSENFYTEREWQVKAFAGLRFQGPKIVNKSMNKVDRTIDKIEDVIIGGED